MLERTQNPDLPPPPPRHSPEQWETLLSSSLYRDQLLLAERKVASRTAYGYLQEGSTPTRLCQIKVFAISFSFASERQRAYLDDQILPPCTLLPTSPIHLYQILSSSFSCNNLSSVLGEATKFATKTRKGEQISPFLVRIGFTCSHKLSTLCGFRARTIRAGPFSLGSPLVK